MTTGKCTNSSHSSPDRYSQLWMIALRLNEGKPSLLFPHTPLMPYLWVGSADEVYGWELHPRGSCDSWVIYCSRIPAETLLAFAVYTTDICWPGMLYACIVLSIVFHAWTSLFRRQHESLIRYTAPNSMMNAAMRALQLNVLHRGPDTYGKCLEIKNTCISFSILYVYGLL